MTDYSERIWKTRKIRINTESRLNTNAIIADIIIPIYALNFILITILPLNKNSNWIPFISISGSLVILIVSIIASNRNFKLRALKMRLHYIKLDQIYKRYCSVPEDEKDNIYQEYLEELKNIENHTEYDYRKTIIKHKKDSESKFPKPTFIDIIKYYLYLIIRWSIILIILSIQFIIDIIIIL